MVHTMVSALPLFTPLLPCDGFVDCIDVTSSGVPHASSTLSPNCAPPNKPPTMQGLSGCRVRRVALSKPFLTSPCRSVRRIIRNTSQPSFFATSHSWAFYATNMCLVKPLTSSTTCCVAVRDYGIVCNLNIQVSAFRCSLTNFITFRSLFLFLTQVHTTLLSVWTWALIRSRGRRQSYESEPRLKKPSCETVMQRRLFIGLSISGIETLLNYLLSEQVLCKPALAFPIAKHSCRGAQTRRRS